VARQRHCVLDAAVAGVAAIPGEPVFETWESLDEGHWCSVLMLSELWSLTRLTLNVNSNECTKIFWRSVGEITSLRHLSIQELNAASFGGIYRLVTCTELTYLEIDHAAENLWFRMTVSLP
jgi:hypothetical protein